jgi:DNA ligase-3
MAAPKTTGTSASACDLRFRTVASSGSGEDNSLASFVRLCDRIAAEASSLQKASILREFVLKGNDGVAFTGDLFLLTKNLLPSDLKRVLNLKDKQLAKVFASILGCDGDKLLQTIEATGDCAQSIADAFGAAAFGSAHSTWSLDHLESFLSQLELLTHLDDQIALVRAFVQGCTVDEVKYLIRLIKHDLRCVGPYWMVFCC